MKSSEATAARARARRVEKGVQTEERARTFTARPSLQGLLQLPLLEELESHGGRAKPSDLYERLADRLDVPDDLRSQKRTCGDGQTYSVFPQAVRWARQNAVMAGLIHKGDRGIWELADPGYAKLKKVRRGVAVLIYSLDDGVALWAHAEDAGRAIEPGSLNLIFTSPPYPTVSREYGRFSVPEWLSWMRSLIGTWKSLLAPDGTICLNVMDTFVSGTPNLSPYIERLTLSCIDDHGLHLAGRSVWHSPTKMGNIQWASKMRVRPRNTLEHLLFFSGSPNPNWDTRRLPAEPYAASTVAAWNRAQKRPSSKRPCGYNINERAFAPTGDGPLPGNLIVAAGAPGNDQFSRRCREAGLPPHPARFPEAIPKRVILLTTEPGQVVYDPMAGSNTTGKVALDLGRRFIASEPSLTYLGASALRFDQRPDFRRHPLPKGLAVPTA
ncbi:site-specific DNA-methyltransferase [Microvirga sp. VF16]|uniref:site-specific DNA-methyltransferase n=1 Tax=Microvirga sp. VF16 TaxID=2807101 RepID=UPI00193E3B6E|nr:site-specific DNA-methyltransferase [Microvirga sp. VF16]QRM35073.1 site-specific DNA-methyltransferase [Microvirga sp. VF16]